MTDIDAAEQALRESELRYRALFDSIDEGFCVCAMLFDADGRPANYRFLEVNAAFERHTGLENAVGYTALELVPDLEPHWLQTYGNVALTGVPARFEQRSAATDRWFNVYAFRFGDPQRRTFGILFTDITAQKRADEQLLKLRARFESALQSGLAGTFHWDVRAERVVIDENLTPYFSLSGPVLDGGIPLDDVVAAIHVEDRTRVVQALTNAVAQREAYQFEYRVNHADGSLRWLSARGVVECDERGEAVGLPGFAIDVTDRRRAEDQLRQSEERYRAIVESQAEMICRFRPDGTILFVNGAYARARGARPDDLIGLDFWNFVGLDDRPHVQVLLDRLHRDAPEVRIENPFATTSGVRWTLWTNRGLAFDAQGRATEIQSSGIDITDRKRAEQALADSETSLRNANQIKDDFLATLSHELRTPLNAVLGWSHMLRSGKLSPGLTKRAIESVEHNAKAQARLVDDLLDMSRIASGKLELQIEQVDLGAVAAGAVDTVRPAALGKGVSLQLTSQGDAAIRVNGDSSRIRQVIWNLLSNAVKFTPAGGRVEIVLRTLGYTAEIAVTDTGEGIGKDLLPFVFDRFRQADAAKTRRHGGLGIGLAIVRQLTEAHGGTVTCLSDGPGTGATFIIRLPLAAAAAPLASAAATERQERRLLQDTRILVVDDEADTRDLLTVILETEGALVTTAESADDILHLLDRERFDVLLADIGMPERDGLTLIRTLRRSAGDHARLPAIAVTAYASARDRAAALDAGFTLHLSKPAAPEELVAAVLAVLPGIGGGPQATST